MESATSQHSLFRSPSKEGGLSSRSYSMGFLHLFCEESLIGLGQNDLPSSTKNIYIESWV